MEVGKVKILLSVPVTLVGKLLYCLFLHKRDNYIKVDFCEFIAVGWVCDATKYKQHMLTLGRSVAANVETP